MPPSIAINGKYLGAPLNGVHRTAALYSRELLARRGDAELVAPIPLPEGTPLDEAGHNRVRVVRGALGAGQGWEMITLPRATRKQLLVNFCNLGPLLHSRSVVMIHDAQTFLHPDDYTGRQATAYRALLPMIGRRAALVLTVSDFSKRSLAEHGVAKAENIAVVHNGTDHILAVEPDIGVLDRLGLTGRPFAMTLGSTKRYKNMSCLFSAFSSDDVGMPLVVAGGPGREAYAADHGKIPQSTVFAGHVSDAELRALYAAATVFLFPSLTEGFGLPPVEAMQCGCPVVAADAGAMPEICGDGAMLVDPRRPGDWHEATRVLCGDADRRARLARRGAERALHFSWDRAGERLVECLAPLTCT